LTSHSILPPYVLRSIKLFEGSPVHVAPAWARSEEGSDHFESYIRSISLHFCKRMFLGLEHMTSWSQGKKITTAPRLPFIYQTLRTLKFLPRKERHSYPLTKMSTNFIFLVQCGLTMIISKKHIFFINLLLV
jgi:hypothetical protein